MPIETPCIRLCRLDATSSVCLSCGRQIEEIAGWAAYPAARRREIMAALPGRLAALAGTV